jgi:acyl-CoA synthetase (NDP forming)
MVNVATFHPRSVLVVQDSSVFGDHATSVEKNCLLLGFEGNVSIVERHDLVSTVSQPSGVPDIAVILLDADNAPYAVRELCDAGVRIVCVISGGYPSTKASAELLREEMRDLAQMYDTVLLGPDGGSFVNMTASVAPFVGGIARTARRGHVAVVSQGMAIIEALTTSDRVALSAAISCGTSAAYSVADALRDLADDTQTTAVLAFIEGVSQGQELLSALSSLTNKGKLVGVCKVGRSEAAIAGVTAHSKAIAGNADVFDAAVRAAGAIACDSLDELITLGEILVVDTLPKGPRTHVVAYSGAEANMVADIAEREGLQLPPISDEGAARLRRLWPELRIANPLDPWFIDLHQTAFAEALSVCASEDGDIVALVLDQSIDAPDETVAITTDLIRLLARHVQTTKKMPVVLSPVHQCPPHRVKLLCKYLGVPLVQGASTGLSVLAKMAARCESRVDERFLAVRSLASGRSGEEIAWDEDRSQAFIAQYGIDVPRRARTANVDDAVTAADSIGYPVVVKGVSAEVVHKQNAGLVWLDVRNSEDVRECSGAVRQRGHRFSIMVAEHIRGDLEVFLGMVRDPVFGPVALLGMGGRWFEATSSVVTALLPMDARDAERLIDDSVVGRAVSALPYGSACRSRLIDVICRLSALSVSEREVLSIDMNPLLATQDRLVAVDALVLIANAASESARIASTP